MIEQWKPVVDYEGLYEVSNLGRVRSLDRKVWNGKAFYTKKGRILKQTKTTTGYWKVELFKDKKKKNMKVHRLVAYAFIPTVKGKTIINHKDGNPLNNRVENLEWCTQSENIYHSYENQLRKNKLNEYFDTLVEEYLKTDINIKQLARKYSLQENSIRTKFKRMGIKIKPISITNDKYKIDRKALVLDFEKGLTNKELAEKYKTNNTLIAAYRYKYRKGELKI